jgi:hypothetical protein
MNLHRIGVIVGAAGVLARSVGRTLDAVERSRSVSIGVPTLRALGDTGRRRLRARREQSLSVIEGSHPRLKQIRVFLLTLGALAASASCAEPKGLGSGKSRPCTTFTRGALTASWSDCPDKARREVRCAAFVEQLKCDCFVDGAEGAFFFKDHPPLSNRAEATQLANANCRWEL